MLNDPDLLYRKILKTAERILSIVGLVLGFFEAHHIFSYLELREDSEKLIAISYILFLCSVLIVVLGLRFGFADRKEKFANISPRNADINNLCKELISSIRYIRERESDPDKVAERFPEIIEKFRGVMDNLSTMFSMLTNTNCRAAIKVINRDNNILYVVGFVRNTNSNKDRPKMDQERADSKNDPLDQNEQFKKIFSDDNPAYYFLSNDLAKEKDFVNTSVKAYNSDKPGVVKDRSLVERVLGDVWPLPYRSTLTTAIRHASSRRRSDEPTVVGFLCVDSESRGVFSSKWDHHICSAVADALYHPLNEFLETVSRVETELGARALKAQAG